MSVLIHQKLSINNVNTNSINYKIKIIFIGQYYNNAMINHLSI